MERAMNNDTRDNLPTIESGGLDDRTIASPALGFGQERKDLLPPEPEPPAPGPGPQQQPSQPAPDRLARNEVAAVSGERSYYVSDSPSPYLSTKQAQENIEDTRRREGIIRGTLVALVVIALLGVAAWVVVNGMSPRELFNAPQYKTTPIEKGEFLDTVDATVLVEPIDTRAVSSGVTGNLQETLVAQGAVVGEGDPLFTLENSTVTDSFNRAQQLFDETSARQAEKKAKLDEANQVVASSQATLDAAKQETERTVAQAALTTAQTLQVAAQSEYDAAETTLQTVTETYNHALEQQEALTVRSPISGTVTDLNAELAQGTAVSSAVQLCTVSDLSRYLLRVEIPSERRGMATEGQEVRITFPEIEDLAITANIASIEDNEGSSVAKVILENPDERITAGAQAKVSLVLQSIPDSYIVPLETVTHAENGSAHLTILLDPTRGIKTDVPVTVVATSPTEAAVSAENIQEGNAVIIPEEATDE